jgi:hypothetical protein
LQSNATGDIRAGEITRLIIDLGKITKPRKEADPKVRGPTVCSPVGKAPKNPASLP